MVKNYKTDLRIASLLYIISQYSDNSLGRVGATIADIAVFVGCSKPTARKLLMKHADKLRFEIVPYGKVGKWLVTIDCDLYDNYMAIQESKKAYINLLGIAYNER